MSEPQVVVLDTNIVLDLFLFQDPKTALLRDKLLSRQWRWIATRHMRNELERVLTYENIAVKLAFYNKSAADILQAFDQHAEPSEAATTKAPYTCKDKDDQAFIDLACHLVAEQTPKAVHLISKDKAVLSMRKRLEKLSVLVSQDAL